MNYLQCKECGTLHYAVSRRWAEKKINNSRWFYNLLVKEKEEIYIGGQLNVMHQFESCHKCGNDYRLFCLAFEPLLSMSVLVYPIISE